MGAAAKKEVAAATRVKGSDEGPHATSYDAVEEPPEVWQHDYGERWMLLGCSSGHCRIGVSLQHAPAGLQRDWWTVRWCTTNAAGQLPAVPNYLSTVNTHPPRRVWHRPCCIRQPLPQRVARRADQHCAGG